MPETISGDLPLTDGCTFPKDMWKLYPHPNGASASLIHRCLSLKAGYLWSVTYTPEPSHSPGGLHWTSSLLSPAPSYSVPPTPLQFFSWRECPLIDNLYLNPCLKKQSHTYINFINIWHSEGNLRYSLEIKREVRVANFDLGVILCLAHSRCSKTFAKWINPWTLAADMHRRQVGWKKGFPDSSAGKESAWNEGDPSSISGSGRSAGEGIGYPLQYSWASFVAQLVKNLPAMQKTWVWSLGWEDPLKKGKATHPNILKNSMDCMV